jgi:amino acid transporter
MTTVAGTPDLVSGPVTTEVEGKGLKTGALGLVSSIVIGVASTAPAYSMAASLGLVTLYLGVGTAVGVLAPGIILIAFIPMLFIAAAYYYMNRADPDCGTTFTWVTRAMGPSLGWMGGWGILMTDLVVMPSLASIAGSYTFALFGAYGLAASTFWTTVVGVIWIIVMVAICYIGIELSATTQVILLGAELVILTIFAVVALVKVYAGNVHKVVVDLSNYGVTGHGTYGSLRPSTAWFEFWHAGWGPISAAMLSAIFIYWGWDTAVTVNEESKDARRGPGLAALLSTVILLLIYLIVSVAAVAYYGPQYLSANYNDILSAMGGSVLGSPWNKLLIIAVLTSASASTQTTILPAARSALSMAVHKAAPARFARIHPRFLSPGYATIFFGVASIVWYVALTIASPGDVLANSISALGFGIAFYYGITGYACVIYYRKVIFKSVKNFLFVGLAPFLGALALTVIFVIALFFYSNPANSATGAQAWFSFIHFNVHILGLHLYVTNGVGPTDVLGIGLLLLGIPLMLIWRARHKQFFKHKPEFADSMDYIAPPLTPGVTPVTD